MPGKLATIKTLSGPPDGRPVFPTVVEPSGEAGRVETTDIILRVVSMRAPLARYSTGVGRSGESRN
jgi:hypothetical protein